MEKLKKSIKSYSRELSTLLALLFIIVIFSIIAPRYLEISNLMDIMEQGTVNGFLAIGVTCAIITGGIDLSVGSAMAVSIVTCGRLAVAGVPPLVVVLVGLGLGAFIGVINGVLVTKMKLQPFIATMGTNSVLRGIAYLITGGWPVLNIPKEYREIFQYSIVPNLRMSMIVLVLMSIVYSFVLKKRKTGVYIYAIGSNEEATKLSGVNTDKFKIMAYMLCSMGAAMAGMVTLARLGAGEPTGGEGYELNAIAAAAIGGTSLAGGKGSILGTVLGALILSALKIGLVVVGMDTFYQYIATGLIIIVAVYLEVVQQKVSGIFSKKKKIA